MAREVCGGCGTRLTVGLLRCPRCRVVAPSYASRVTDRPLVADPLAKLEELPFKQLRAMAKAQGVSGAGTAADLAARLAEHQRAQAAREGG